MTSNSSFNLRRILLVFGALALQPLLLAQGSAVLTVTAPPKTVVKRNGAAESKLAVQLKSGYHVNSDTPSEDYLIPLRLTWDESGPVKATEVVYPKPEMRNYEFSSKPVSVFTGDFPILVRLKAAPMAPAGPGVLVGKLRYQACSQNACFPPRTVEVRLPYDVQ